MITATDSHFVGLNLNSAGSSAVLSNVTTGGKSHIFHDKDGIPRLGPDNFRDQLGNVVLGLSAWAINLFGSAGQYAYALTSRGIYQIASNNEGRRLVWEKPANLAFSGCTMVPGSTTYLVMFGPNGTLYKMVLGGTTPTAVAVGGRTTDWIAAVNSGYLGTTGDGKTWLLGGDGSITEYDAVNDTLTDRTSNVTFPLTGGHRQGSTILVWGGNPSGATDGTAGGVIVSTDTGASWGTSLARADNTPSGIGATYAYRVRCGTYVNGQWVLFGARGTMLTSTTGATGSWAARSLRYDIDVRFCASDNITSGTVGTPTAKRILIGGDANGGTNLGRGQALVLIDTTPSNTDPTLWTFQNVEVPVSAVGGIAFVANWQQNTAIFRWVIAGRVAEWAHSEDSRNWRRSRALPVGQYTPLLRPEAKRISSLLPV